MSNYNPNCDGSHCRGDLEVRVYPLGGGANLILCQACFANENRYNHMRGIEQKAPENWPQRNWETSEKYPE